MIKEVDKMINTSKLVGTFKVPDIYVSSSTLEKKRYNLDYLNKNNAIDNFNNGNNIVITYEDKDGNTISTQINHLRTSSNPITIWTEEMFPEFFYRNINSVETILENSASIAASRGYRVKEVR